MWKLLLVVMNSELKKIKSRVESECRLFAEIRRVRCGRMLDWPVAARPDSGSETRDSRYRTPVSFYSPPRRPEATCMLPIPVDW